MSLKSQEKWEGSWPQTIEQFEHFIDVNQNRMIRHALMIEFKIFSTLNLIS